MSRRAISALRTLPPGKCNSRKTAMLSLLHAQSSIRNAKSEWTSAGVSFYLSKLKYLRIQQSLNRQLTGFPFLQYWLLSDETQHLPYIPIATQQQQSLLCYLSTKSIQRSAQQLNLSPSSTLDALQEGTEILIANRNTYLEFLWPLRSIALWVERPIRVFPHNIISQQLEAKLLTIGSTLLSAINHLEHNRLYLNETAPAMQFNHVDCHELHELFQEHGAQHLLTRLAKRLGVITKPSSEADWLYH